MADVNIVMAVNRGVHALVRIGLKTGTVHCYHSIIYIYCLTYMNGTLQSFPIRSKFHWTVGPVNLKLLPEQKKFHRTVGGQRSILTL